MRQKLFIFALVFIVLLLSLRFYPRESLLADLTYSRAVYSADGSLLRLSLAEDESFRLYMPLSDISPSFVSATLFYEDRWFWQHPGLNPVSILRSFSSTYIKKNRTMGASTITMQLARRVYGIKSSNIGGKLKQIAAAVWIEARYSKEDILEAYLNSAPYGHNIEGAGAASLIYFGKRAAELTLVESMTLAVIPQNPVKRVPTNDKGLAELKLARDKLADAWLSKHLENIDLRAHFDLPMDIGKIGYLPFAAPHFVEGLLADYPAKSELFSTLDLSFQTILEEQIGVYVRDMGRFGIHNAAAMLVDTETMHVLASVGSADFFNDSIEGQVDGTRAMRSPGSLLKPFIYALAAEQGIIHPRSIVKDAPRRYGIYTPENADGDFMGPLTAMEALNHSRNIPAVDMLLALEPNSFWELLSKAGIKDLKEPEHYGVSIALGGLEISMEDAARMISALNNEGELRQLIKLADEADREQMRLLSPEAAYMVRDMMKHNSPPQLDGYFVRLPVRAAWKTGTSYRFRDAWAGGIFDKYVLIVWVGNFSGEGNPAFNGRGAAGRLFFKILTRLAAGSSIPHEKTEIPVGLNLKYVEVCKVTGELPADYCPELVPSLFIPGVSPIKVSDVFMRIPVDIETGLRACSYDPTTTRWEVYEFWSADMLSLFEQAGIRRKVPPRYMPGCTLDKVSYRGIPPEISYPQVDVIYDISSFPGGNDELPLMAASGADAETLYWFVDGRFVGQSPNGMPFFWKASAGKHYLQVVDNLGRTSSLDFEVN